MRPLILAPGVPAPAGALAVDGDTPGAAAYLSHWPGTPEPPAAYAADTATGMALRAAASGWLDRFSLVCNNHLDADGLLALVACCRPACALRHADVLEAAAEAGDFTLWRGPRAHRLLLAVHQLLRRHQGHDQAALDEAMERPEDLIAAADRPDPERDAEIAQIETALVGPAIHGVVSAGGLAIVRWTRRLGHRWDVFGAVHQPDDLPQAAIAASLADDDFQLAIEDSGSGPVIVWSAPGHSWARTVVRPRVSWPDAGALAAALQQDERNPGRWVAGAEARRVGFTVLLALVDADFRPLPTSQDPAAVATRIRRLLST
jgi:hypothetical protein